ncbi:sugar isomerase domain-containing protein [Arthrobacter sp. B2a2-09]|uniref:sugar isomerase domain-containing protein n=1 Tax=Arthrobacter sp. B2a2-09 TaxID=2952822 RepID=UPI0022CD91D4|nr:sugar isomerase domain-containing protein [Arthrobacter sp. B2a2-09]MCZ9882788.1 sugar isomerase domain-containing protein [Arthrobacter sp. B2a2-09]
MNTSEQLSGDYLGKITELLGRIRLEEAENISVAAGILAAQVAKDELVHIYGPGGHSNLASQEVFFRAGGLMHVSAILDEGTLLSSGALRSMAMERTPGYGRIVIEDAGLGPGDVLILVNAYGINSALIDAALTARELSVKTIGVSSREHAEETARDHPARHPQKLNLHDVVDHHIDTKVPVGDAVMTVPGSVEKTAAVSTFANAFTLNWLMMSTISKLNEIGIEPPLWRSGNAPGGDAANQQFISRFKGRVHKL